MLRKPNKWEESKEGISPFMEASNVSIWLSPKDAVIVGEVLNQAQKVCSGAKYRILHGPQYVPL